MNRFTAIASTLVLAGILAGPAMTLANPLSSENKTAGTPKFTEKNSNKTKPTDNWQGVLFRIMGGISKDIKALTGIYMQDLQKTGYTNLYQLQQINSIAVVKDRVVRVRQLVIIHDKLVVDMAVFPSRFDRELAASGLVEKHRVKVSRGVHKGFRNSFGRLKLENRVIHKLAELYEYLNKHQVNLEFSKQGMSFRDNKRNDAYNKIIEEFNKLAIAYQKAIKTGVVPGQKSQQKPDKSQKPPAKQSSTTGDQKKTGQLAASGEKTGVAVTSKDPVCRQYANTAVKQNKFNVNVQCGFTGARWGSNYSGHYSWCVNNKSTGLHTTEQHARKSGLERCIKQKLHLTGK